MKIVLRFLALVLFLSSFFSSANASALYYILDGSGSMWGRVDSKMKIQVAKEVMTRLITETPPETDFGLTVYGHLRKGDCSDITELIPLGQSDRDHAIAAINRIKPKGKTPLSKSIEKTVKNIQGREDSSTIVLVSDGIETCGGDPCAVTRALKESGMKFILHVVGFDVDKKAAAQLNCIAEAGGGRYFSSSNGDELLAALSTVQRSVENKVTIEAALPEVMPEPVTVVTPEPKKVTQEVAKSSTSVRIKAKGPGKIRFSHHPWLKQPHYWKLIDPETGEEKGTFRSLETTLVPPGVYQIVWDQYEHGSAEIALAEVVKVESGKTSEVPLFTALRLNVPDWVKDPYYWGLREPETGEIIVTFNRLEPFLVPAGNYELIWRQGEHSAQDTLVAAITIEPDILNDVELSTAINPVPADWLQRKIHYWGLQKNDSEHSSDWSAWFSDNFAPQLVAPGKYKLIYDISEHGSSDSLLGEVDIVQGQLTDFPVNSGVTFIPQPGMKPPYFIDFTELDENGTAIRTVKLSNSFGPIALKPGIYKIDYRQKQHGGSTMTIVDSFELPQGTLVEIEL